MRLHYATEPDAWRHHGANGVVAGASADFRTASAEPPRQPSTRRYSDRPVGWRTRLVGIGGTSGVFLGFAFAAFFTWRVVHPLITPPAPITIFNLESVAAPPAPVREVPDGPEQVEQREQRPKQPDRPDPPEILMSRLSALTRPVPPPVEQVPPADPVQETTAPKSLPAPPARQASSDTEASWEALVMARLEKYRRYPASARSRGEQGVAFLTFRMNRQGRVLASRVSRSAGSALLDRAALETLRRAEPLPAIPDHKPDEVELTVQVEFFVRL